MRELDFLFDPVSPYAWLAARAFDRIDGASLRVPVHVRCVPVLFAGLLKAHGKLGPAIPSTRWRPCACARRSPAMTKVAGWRWP